MKLGEKIKLVRKHRGLTQRELPDDVLGTISDMIDAFRG